MKQSSIRLILAILILALIPACASKLKENSIVYDRELIYDRPYDYTYLKTMEALNTFPDWVLEETDKVKGLIVIRNTQYGHLFDRDKWTARFTVKSLGRKKTSVRLEPVSQRLEKGGELLDRIDQIMLASSAVQAEKQAQLVS
ncbi:MAG: hypothetical protein HY585_01690 [Candidatus Omnitrophica bacterium]|nr:hypothetical protein [Candidatus Omnitrophota bacterium]